MTKKELLARCDELEEEFKNIHDKIGDLLELEDEEDEETDDTEEDEDEG